MEFTTHSSGNMTADRRFAYAEDLVREGDLPAAIDLLNQTMDLVPSWPAGWFRLGEVLERAGDVQAACGAFRKCLAVSQADILGAGLKLAFLEGRREEKPALAYAEALFDDYAEQFDSALVNRLGYRVPALLAKMLEDNLPDAELPRVLDLGCGTGLMAAEVRARCGFLTGADISGRMLAKARAKGLYNALVKADLVAALAAETGLALVMAADVFMYIPALDGVFSAVANALTGEGHFLFSVEKSENPDGWELLESRRHAHGQRYIERLLSGSGFSVVERREGVIRMDGGRPLTGLLYLARLEATPA